VTVLSGKIMPDDPVPTRRDLGDPPVFILMASPLWAPWLPDTTYQKVFIGSAGQVLTVNADGSIGWSNSSSGFGNPMTTTGDMIYSNPGSTPVRLAIGASGNVLLVAGGVPAWSAPPWLTNPITTLGDLIVGSGGTAAGRLGIGASNQVLTVVAGAVAWANSAAGFANPMTTLGDIITAAGGGAAQRLGAGAAGQVLTIVGGVPAWANSASGFANPMTAQGDMISGGLAGVATRLPAGANGQVLTVVSGSPAWASGQSAASAVVFPSGDTTGVTDRANITNAYPPNGGEVLLANGQFYVKPPSGLNCLTVPAQTTATVEGNTTGGWPVCLRGLGKSTVIYPVGAGVTGIYYHRTGGYGAQYGLAAQPQTGYLRDFVVDGTFATGASRGISVGDGWGYELDVGIVNFTGTGAIGLVISDDVFWTEKSGPFRANLSNNSQAALLTTTVGNHDHSHEYNEYDFRIFCNANQQGVVVDGVNQGGSRITLRGNMSVSNGSAAAPPSNIAALTIQNTVSPVSPESRWYAGEIHIKVEGNSGNGTGTTFPYMMYSDGNGYVRNCLVRLALSSLTPSNWNNAEFSARGLIADSSLSQLDTGAAGSGTNGISCTYQPLTATTTNGSANFTCSGGLLFAVGSAVSLVGTIPGAFNANTIYYVVSSAGSVMTLSATTGGAPITATSTVTTGLTLNPAAPPVPASGTIQQNYGPDAMVFLSGGTGVTVTLQGNPVANAPGPFFIPAGGALTVNYTTAPTWIWAPCSQSQY